MLLEVVKATTRLHNEGLSIVDGRRDAATISKGAIHAKTRPDLLSSKIAQECMEARHVHLTPEFLLQSANPIRAAMVKTCAS